MLSVWNASGSLHDPKGDDNKNNKKNNRFNKQNNNFARASPFFVHFFAINCYTTTTWNFLVLRFMEDMNTDNFLLFLFRNLDVAVL